MLQSWRAVFARFRALLRSDAAGVRGNWDLDNVTAPIVPAAGDMVTLPALFLATYLVGIPWLTTIVAVFCAAVALVALFASIRSKYPILRRIARESLPVLVLAG